MHRWLTLITILPLVASAQRQPATPAAAGVYLDVATVAGGEGGIDRVVADVRAAVTGAGWTVLADYEAGVNRQKCAYRAHVFIVDWPDYTRAALRDTRLGAFAAQVRVSVFEDEKGVHVSAVNPRSLSRTIVAETGRDAEWAALATGIEQALRPRMPGRVTEYGQLRDDGRIGRTMGVMAGGPFPGKVTTIHSAPLAGETLDAYAAALFTRLEKQAGAGEWRLRPVFLQKTTDADVIVIGMASDIVEARSFDIVHAGRDAARSAMRCPGIDHAAAYPLEVVLVKEGTTVQAQMIDAMFRMKMYFEDAGKMAFMKNMGMPGSIADELKQKVRAAAATPRRPS